MNVDPSPSQPISVDPVPPAAPARRESPADLRASFAGSKFRAPVLPKHHVVRPALSARLDDAATLGVVVGSPGSGKTTLLSEWYHAQPQQRVGWLTADGGDADPVRFWLAVHAVISDLRPSFTDDCRDLLNLSTHVDHEILECLLRSANSLTDPLAVVIDDLHLLGDEVQEQLRFVVHRDLTPVRLIVGSRSDPSLGLPRLRLDGRLTELREADLRLKPSEASRLLRRLGVELSPDGVEQVMTRTEGWAAGIHLAALVLHDADDRVDVLDRLSGTNRVIAHYLLSEVFASQRPDVQRFLLDTCIVDELTPSLASALSPGNPVTLLDVEDANLLLHRLDDAGSTFRFHQFFADLLRFRLRSTTPHDEVQLHKRAAEWYASCGQPIAAFRHRWRAGERTGALEAIHGTVLDLVYEGLPALTAFEQALTDDDIRAAPGPAASFAVALITGGFLEEADRLTRRIHVVVRDRLTAQEAEQLTATEAIAALVLGDTRRAAELHQRRGEQETVDQGIWPAMTRLAACKANIWEGEYDDAATLLTTRIRSEPSALERMEVGSTTAQLHLFRGELDDARRAASAIIEVLSSELGRGLVDGRLATVVLGTALVEQGDRAQGEDLLRQALGATLTFRVPSHVLANITLSRLSVIDGRLDAALVSVRRAYDLIRCRPPRSGILDFVLAQHVRVLTAGGDVAGAEQVLTGHRPGPRRELLAAELDIASGRLDRASHRLDGLAVIADDDGRCPRDRLEASRARLEVETAGGSDGGRRAVTVLELAETNHAVLALSETTTAALRSLQREARRLPTSSFTDGVMRARPRVNGPGPRARSSEPLTDRELTVLRYMATNLSYREVADELYVSVNTVKTHVRNVKRKLDVASRDEAVARARVLDYLS